MSDETAQPQFDDLEVEILDQEGHPTAMIALVRQALQEAGHGDEARTFTHEALAAGPEGIAEVAQRYVRIR